MRNGDRGGWQGMTGRSERYGSAMWPCWATRAVWVHPGEAGGQETANYPPSLQDLRETVPPGLDRVVRKAMARLPADRQGTVEEFAVSLRASRTAAEPVTRRRTIAAGVLTAIVLIAAAVALGRGAGDASGGADLRSIAVMPFAIQSAKADQDVTFFADGVHSDLLTQLSKIDSLTVVSRTSVVSLGESGWSVAEIARHMERTPEAVAGLLMATEVRFLG